MLKKGFIKLYDIFSVINVEKKMGEEIHEQCTMLSVPLNWSRNNGF
jgi:hypothetical protein